MFGKINAYTVYLVNALKVYPIQRFPANKVSLWGLTISTAMSLYLLQKLSYKIGVKKNNCQCTNQEL